MEYNYQETLKQLKKDLLNLDISCSLESVPNVEDVSIIINNYSPTDNQRPISLAFSINIQNKIFNPKCWLTEDNLKEIEGRHLPLHSAYKEFSYKDKHFYPFSVNLSDYKVDPNSIQILCKQIYQHIKSTDFSDIKSMRDVSRFKSTDDVDKYLEELRG